MNRLRIELPYPPSVNHYWRNFNGRSIISAEGRKYKATTHAILTAAGVKPFTGRVAVTVWAWMPDRRRRDVANLEKCLGDSLIKFAYIDDCQIDDVRLVRAGIVKGGTVLVDVQEIEAAALDLSKMRQQMVG